MNTLRYSRPLLWVFLLGGCLGDSPRPAPRERSAVRDASLPIDLVELAAPHDARVSPAPADAGPHPAPDLAPAREPARLLGELEGAPEWAEQDPTDLLALTLFRQAPPTLEAPVLTDARIACTIRNPTASIFSFLRHGISTVAHFGAAPPIFHKGLGASSSSEFIVPVRELRTGDLWTVASADRDSWSREAPDYVPYAGRFPLRLKPPGIDVECRALTRAQLDAMLPQQLAAVATAMSKVRMKVVPDQENLGRDASGLPLVLRTLYEAAATAGWSDAQIRARSAAVANLLERWGQLASAAVARMAAPLPRAGTSIEVKGVGRVRVLPLRCIPKDVSQEVEKLEYWDLMSSRCFIEFEITPQRLMAVEQIYCATHERSLCLGRLRLILANGTTTRPKVYQVRPAGTPFVGNSKSVKDLAAGQTHLILLDPRTRVAQEPSPLRPMLLQGSFGTLRLE